MYKYWIISIFFIITLTLSLGPVTKYAYINENAHYHTGTCHINNCTIKDTTTCGMYNNRVCYIVNVTYNLSLLNGTQNYSQQESGIITRDDFCDWTSIICFYDDRDIAQSLRLWVEYASIYLFAVIFISCGLGVAVLFFLSFSYILYAKNEGVINNINKSNSEEITYDDSMIVELSEV